MIFDGVFPCGANGGTGAGLAGCPGCAGAGECTVVGSLGTGTDTKGNAAPCSLSGGASDQGAGSKVDADCGGGRGALNNPGGGGVPSVSVGRIVEGNCRRAVRFSARSRWRIVEKTR